MSEGPLGSRAEPAPLYRKIFTGFRIALDIKKLLLAAAGIFLTWLGWFALSNIFYLNAEMPQWNGNDDDTAAWVQFQKDRKSWNLLHELAGPTDPPVFYDVADVAGDPKQFKELKEIALGSKILVVDAEKGELKDLAAKDQAIVYAFTPAEKSDLAALKRIAHVRFADLRFDKDKQLVLVGGIPVTVDKQFAKFVELHEGGRGIETISADTRGPVEKSLALLQRPKPAGKFRISPWSENRGPNPYLLVSDAFTSGTVPFAQGGFLGWLLHVELPVLLEPLVKFISPVLFLFSGEAGTFRITTYLILIIVWNLLVWGYFGAAICRLAAVQVARNEKAPLGETLGFVGDRYRHFLLAPAMPLLFLGLLFFLLAAGGFIAGWTFFVGDILAGLLWPLIIVAGLIMAVLLVGLIGWPLMYPTISVEGSDSFDALSRTYSYFYQKPWRYLGYGGTALAYGVVLTFFVGFMGSLIVHVGQLGYQGAIGQYNSKVESDRTQAFLFQHAPTSFGLRDLCLKNSPWAEPVPGAEHHWQLKPEYAAGNPGPVGTFASWLVGFWLGLLFLLVLGFSYSYFWTASTILYFLMRKCVDDIDLDEVHLEDDEVIAPPPPAPPAAAPAKPGTIPLSVVEGPPPMPPPVAEPPKSEAPR